MVATATKKRNTKKATKRRPVASRAAKPAASKAAGQSNKFATEQPPIKGMEDTDERIAELEEECQRHMAAKDKQSIGKTDEGEAAGKITNLLKKHDLNLYIFQGKKYYIEPGAESLKCVKVKQKG